MKKILLIGSDGMLGSRLGLLLANLKEDVVCSTIKDMDITKENCIAKIINLNPQIIINCSAYTAVDKAEDEPEKAQAVNVEGVRNIVKATKAMGAFLVHYSTDYIFGKDEHLNPIDEESNPAPLGVYGETKRQGEELIIDELASDKFLILRTAWLYGENGKNFVNKMLELSKKQSELKIVADQQGSPTYTKDLAAWTYALLNKKASGIFHTVNSGSCSWYEFAKEIFKIKGLEVKVNPVSTLEYPVKATRPKYSVLNNHKLTSFLEKEVRDWQEALSEYLLFNKL